ncbi:MAG: hypothetical protein KGM98_11825 [Bacteroidota bacterium]|nr:hypothetical protein [Bacteroidota bacterium]
MEKKPRRIKRRKRPFYYQWMEKNIPFYLFAALLAIIYIANGHYADNTVRKINSTAKHVQDMEYEYKTIKQDVIFRSKESEVAKAVEPLGLKVLRVPPVRLIDTIQNK